MILNTSEYRRSVDDYSSFDGDVNDALVEAQAEAERITGRVFDLGSYTESLEIYDGHVYPRATPVSVTGGIVSGDSIVLGYWSRDWTNSWYSNDYSSYYPYNRIAVSYTGGWTNETAPLSLKKILYRIVKSRLVKPAIDVSNYPMGTTSVSQIDQSISFRGPVKTGGDPAALLLSDLRPWVLPHI